MALFRLLSVYLFLMAAFIWPIALLHAQTQEQVSFTVTDEKERVAIEERFRFKAQVTNRGDEALTGATIRLTVAPYLLPENIQPQPSSSDPQTRVIVWENQTIPAQTTREFSFEALAEQGTPGGQVLTSRGEFFTEAITLSASDSVQVVAAQSLSQPVTVTAPTGSTPVLWLILAAALLSSVLFVYSISLTRGHV